jgi:competence protein CoiA
MQLYAFDSQNQLTFAGRAHKQRDYLCPECKSTVRLRGGIHRQNHFYHLEGCRLCRQSGKSFEHLNVQLSFLEALPKGECFLEFPFPSINRIADVVWIEKKLVFEVQCSPISASEVRERNRDYASEGFRVIWILHDNRYNKPRLSGMEHVLHLEPHYFTNISKGGAGVIYDQFSVVQGGIRQKVLPPLPIDVSAPCSFEGRKCGAISLQAVQSRLSRWPIHFAGDLTESLLNANPNRREYIAEAEGVERNYLPITSPLPVRGWRGLTSIFYRFIARPYKLIFQLLLERSCK